MKTNIEKYTFRARDSSLSRIEFGIPINEAHCFIANSERARALQLPPITPRSSFDVGSSSDAPLILLENRNWESELERFFTRKGDVFWPVLSLYGPMLREYRRRDLRAGEAVLGEPSLDLDRIRRHRVVITNYEALRD